MEPGSTYLLLFNELNRKRDYFNNSGHPLFLLSVNPLLFNSFFFKNTKYRGNYKLTFYFHWVLQQFFIPVKFVRRTPRNEQRNQTSYLHYILILIMPTKQVVHIVSVSVIEFQTTNKQIPISIAFNLKQGFRPEDISHICTHFLLILTNTNPSKACSLVRNLTGACFLQILKYLTINLIERNFLIQDNAVYVCTSTYTLHSAAMDAIVHQSLMVSCST